ncbi:Putative ribonuclease H protein At1g65750 [Linum perenne]
MTWVRLPKLPIHFFNELAVTRIGNSIGRTVPLDLATSEGARARYARVCVEVDLTKPLLGKYMIEDRTFHVEYESLERICFNCGIYGHRIDECPSRPTPVVTPPQVESEDVPQVNAETDGAIGELMTVRRRTKGQQSKPAPSTTRGKGSGSRFDVLGSEVSENVRKGPEPEKTGSSKQNPDNFQDLARRLDAVLKAAATSPADNTVKSNLKAGKKETPTPLGDITNSGKSVTISQPSKAVNGGTAGTVDSSSVVTAPVVYHNPIFSGASTMTTCEAIDRKIRNFVWGSSDEARKVHLVSWENICRAKEDGGLGLKLAHELNRAYMTKLAFIFMQDSDRLWVRLLQGKYFSVTADGLARRNPNSRSSVWKGITRDWETMVRGARSAIRNGKDTMFWTARWIDSGERLIDLLVDANAEIQIDDSVADFVNIDGQWDVDKLRASLPPSVIEMVIGMTPPREDRGDDHWVWGEDAHGRFSIKSAYRLICNRPASQYPNAWKTIWGWKGPNRIRTFLWLAIQDKLLTNISRARRHMTTDASCPRCRIEEEDTIHVLRDCAFAREVWDKFPMFDLARTVWQEPISDWICGHLNSEADKRRGKAAAGGLLRDFDGRCITAFAMNLGSCSITRAEMRGAVEGLQRAWDLGYRRILLRMDSVAAISLLMGRGEPTHHHGLETALFQDLCRRDWQVVVRHIFREGNHAADYLASIGYDYPFGSHTVSSSDCNLVYHLRHFIIATVQLRRPRRSFRLPSAELKSRSQGAAHVGILFSSPCIEKVYGSELKDPLHNPVPLSGMKNRCYSWLLVHIRQLVVLVLLQWKSLNYKLVSMLNLSHNAPVQPNGYNEEEMKLVKETRRIWIVDESSEADRRSFTGEEHNTNTPSPQKSAPEQNW